MCGILGFVTAKPSEENAKYFKRILRLSQSRGSDATGIAYHIGNRLIVDKAPVDATQFIKETLPKHHKHIVIARWAIGHTRAPTVGSPKNNVNNHPVESDNWIIIHNGTVTNMDRLKNYKYKGEVDTEVLLSYIEEYGIEKAVPYVARGSAAICAINRKDLNTLYLWREASPIKMAYDDASKTIFFASEEGFLEKGLANQMLLFTSFQIRDLPNNLLIKVTVDPLKVDPVDYIAVHKTTYSYNYGYGEYGNSYSGGYNWRKPKLVYNKDLHRWETPEELEKHTKAEEKVETLSESKQETDKDKEGRKMIDGVLIDMGYTIADIGRMTEGTKATIIYRGVPSSMASITEDGKLTDKRSEPAKVTLPNKYYLASKDFKGWIKLSPPNRGYLSADGTLIKKWDKEKMTHYIMSWEDAVKEKLVDELALEKDYAHSIGYTNENKEEQQLSKEELKE